ncbi:MAG: hypothetical protein AB8H03_22450 [Saprospiraceae bacterium]
MTSVFRFNTKGNKGIRRLSISNGKVYGLRSNPYYNLLEFDLREEKVKEYYFDWESITTHMPSDFNIFSNGKVSILERETRMID